MAHSKESKRRVVQKANWGFGRNEDFLDLREIDKIKIVVCTVMECIGGWSCGVCSSIG